MTIKHLGGVFGRNPTFNDVTIEGTLTFDGAVDITTDLTIDGVLTANGLIVNGADSIGIDDYILHNGDNNTKFGFPSSDTFKIRTGGQDALYIDSTQKVGINNSNPLQPLHVSGVDGIGIDDYIIHNGDGNTKFGFSGTDTFKIRTGGQDAVFVDSNQNLLVGKSSPDFTAAGHEIKSGSFAGFTRDGGAAIIANRLTSDGTVVEFYKDGTSVGKVGSLSGTHIVIDSAGDRAGLRFETNGLLPRKNSAMADGTVTLGNPSYRFDDIYSTNGTIQTSDRNEKQDIEELSDAEHRVAVAAKGLLRKFRWISAVEEEDDEARIHFGIIAQDLQSAFEAEGLDAGRYGMFIHTTWTDEETGEERSRLGVRYSELLAFIIAAI